MRPTITTVKSFVKEKMSGEATGHDYYHVERVYKMAIYISKKESVPVDSFILKVGALLHDIGDWKLNSTSLSEEEIIGAACNKLQIEDKDAQKITDIITNMSYSKSLSGARKLSIEGQIIQDADRLEALGAIGIARAFAYGGRQNRPLYDPTEKPRKYSSTEEYRTSQGHTINHFYEKLFLIKNTLNTKSAKRIATKREQLMKDFLKEFYSEWEVKV